MSDYKIIVRLSSCASLHVWNVLMWHHRCKGDTWKCGLTGKSELAQSQKCGFGGVCVYVRTPRCASLLGVILQTSNLGFLLYLSKSRSDSLGPGSHVRVFFFLLVIYCQWCRCRGTYTRRYSSFLGSTKNGLGNGLRLKWGLLIPHGSRLYTWKRLCLVLLVFLGYIFVSSSAQPVSERKSYLLLSHVFSF